MFKDISEKEKTYLRELAARQAEYAARPEMAERKQMWLDLNDGRSGARPPLVIEEGTLDESAWREHIRETLEAARDVFLEIIVRDVYTVHCNLDKPRRAAEIAREEVERFYD